MPFSNIYIFNYFIFFIAFANVTFAQDTYATQHGVLYITNKEAKNPVKLHSNSIHVFLNMNTAQFDFSIPIKLLHSNIDSLNSEIKKAEDSVIKINGFINLDLIDTKPHDPIQFEFVAKIQYINQSEDLKGYGYLQHIPGNEQPACRLSLNFEVEDFELFKNYRDDLSFQVIQSILNQTTVD